MSRWMQEAEPPQAQRGRCVPSTHSAVAPPSDLTRLCARVRRCLQSVSQTEELRAKNTSLITEVKQMNHRLQALSRCREELRFDEREDELQHTHRCEMEQVRCRSGASRGRCCEVQARDFKQTISEMEKFYQSRVKEARAALKEEKEQFRSFKDRVALEVALSLKTEHTENMESPVNQSRLTEMFHQLRVCTWSSIPLPHTDQEARTLVQEMFASAAEHMEVQVQMVKALSPEVDRFRRAALENLQLALFHSDKQDVFQAAFPHFEGGAGEVRLASECYWLGCLMALHRPPLQPQWDDEGRSVFPRDVRLQRQVQIL